MLRFADMRVAGVVILAAITSLAALHHNWGEVARTQECDTTYIYEGYRDVPLPAALAAAFPKYKLVGYADRDPSLQQGKFSENFRHSFEAYFKLVDRFHITKDIFNEVD